MSNDNDLKAFIDNELSSPDMNTMQAALQSDPELANAKADFEKIGNTLRLVKNVDPKQGAKEELLRKLRVGELETKEKPKPFWIRSKWGVGIAATLGFGVLAYVVPPMLAQAKEQPAQYATAAISNEARYAEPLERDVKSDSSSARYLKAPMPSKKAGKGESMADTTASVNAPFEVPQNFGAEGEAAKPGTPSRPFANVPALKQELIRKGDFGFHVDDVRKAEVELKTLVNLHKGVITSSNSLGTPVEAANFSISVPAPAFDSLTSKLEGLGVPFMRNISSEDAAGATISITARIKTLQIEEAQLQELMAKTRNVGEVLQVRDRISEVRSEIEQLSGQKAYYSNAVAISTLNVTLKKKVSAVAPVNPNAQSAFFQSAVKDSVETLTSILQFIVRMFLQALALAPIWIPVMIAVYFGLKYSQRNNRY